MRHLITAALPYANAELHLGHIRSTYLPADILARFLRAKGEKVIYACATDEHGTPILVKAEQAGMKPEEFVKMWYERDKEDFEALGISFDVFYRTHTKRHMEMTQEFFLKHYEKGYIYKKEVEQLYCPTCERFLPDRYVRGSCPYCGAPNQYGDYCEVCGRTYEARQLENAKCAVCGSKPEIRKSKHFFFKLSAFSKELEEWLKSNRNLQRAVVNYVLNWIKEGLVDWDITRDMDWGVPVPLEGEEGKVLYVWYDAPIGYISSTAEWAEKHEESWQDYWKGDDVRIYHFIGKDIVYHHFLFWPAMLMSLGLKLPDHIPVRGFLKLEGKKFSKSRGHYISVREFLNRYPADYLRYYLTMITPYSIEDGNFSMLEFKKKINDELIGIFGNFVHRVLSFVWKNFAGIIPEPHEKHGEVEKALREGFEEITQKLEAIKLKSALERVMEVASFGNRYFNAQEPWRTIKVRKEKAGTCLYYSTWIVKFLAITSQPFIPFSAQKIWQLLGFEDQVSEARWDQALEPLKPGHRIKKPKVLFRKVEEERW